MTGAEKIKVTVLDLATGKQIKQYSLNAVADTGVVGPSACTDSCTSFPFIALSEKPSKGIRFNLLGSTKVSTLTIDNAGGEDIEGFTIHPPCGGDGLPHFLVHLRTKGRQWAEVFHIDLRTGTVSKAYNLPKTQETSAFSASTVDGNVFFTRVTDTEVSLYSSSSHGILGRWPRNSKAFGEPLHAVSEVVSRGKSSFAIRVAETSSGGEWSLIRNGETIWTRPEMLAYAVAAAWAEGRPEEALVHALEAEVSGNPLGAYLRRVKRHAQDLAYFPDWIQQWPQNLFQGLFAPNTIAVKDMTGSKTLIMATSHQSLFAVDATTGSIKWKWKRGHVLDGLFPVKSLFVLDGRIQAHFLDGSLEVALNATDGSLIEIKQDMPSFKKMVQLPGIRGLATIRVQPDGTPQLANDSESSRALDGTSIITISQKGGASGWAIGQTTRELWSFRPSPGFKLVNAVARPDHDPVASIGKVLGDRSVLYKYLSRNLALLTAVSEDALTVYLVESVTGTVLHTSTYTGVDTKKSIPSVMSENWLAYSFFGENSPGSAKSQQLIVTELYESDMPNDRGLLGDTTNFSSFDTNAMAKPYVLSQAFAVAESINHLAVTQTSQGITSRQLLCSLPDSNAVIGVPVHVLDPRRPMDRDASALEAEEGLMKYSPILELEPKYFLTHSREVLGVEKIVSSATFLESTSLVFGFGHDIFGTKISPSMTFDVLGKGFNKVQLLLTVVALAVGVGFLAPLVRKRQVESRWKLL